MPTASSKDSIIGRRLHPCQLRQLILAQTKVSPSRSKVLARRPWPQAETLGRTTSNTGSVFAEYSTPCIICLVETLTHGAVLARFGHALSDPTRARVLLSLRNEPGYPSELAETLRVSRQSLSNHLACLRGCGLVLAVPDGRRIRYELADQRLGHALDDLMGVVLTVDPQHGQSVADDG